MFNLPKVLLLAQSALIFVALQNGLGKFNTTTTAAQWHTSGKVRDQKVLYNSNLLYLFPPNRKPKMFFSSEILSITVLSLGKCSVVALIFRIFAVDRGRPWVYCWMLLALCALWGVCSVAGLAVDCNSAEILTTRSILLCRGQVRAPGPTAA